MNIRNRTFLHWLRGNEISYVASMVIIIVFSNEMPDVDQLSKDRWKIFQIRDEDLLDATEKYV